MEAGKRASAVSVCVCIRWAFDLGDQTLPNGLGLLRYDCGNSCERIADHGGSKSEAKAVVGNVCSAADAAGAATSSRGPWRSRVMFENR